MIKAYEDLYDNSPDMLLTVDVKSHLITNCNQAFAEKLGYSKEEVIGKLKREDILHPDYFEENIKLVNDFLQHGYIVGREIIIRKKDGSCLHVSVSSNAIYDEQGNIIRSQTALRNISKLINARNKTKKYHNKIKVYSNELKRTNKNLDLFAFAASHDLKSPLRAISMYAQFALNSLQEKNLAITQDYLNQIINRITCMDKFLNDMLSYFRTNPLAEKTEKIDAYQLIEEISSFIDKPENFQLVISKNMPVFMSYRMPLHQIFLNLINNAIKHHHNPKKGKIEISAAEEEKYFIFSVKDNGPGIKDEYQHSIFQMFKTISETDRANTGMGLAMVKTLLERYGGSIYLISQEGEGSCFYFKWPKEINLL